MISKNFLKHIKTLKQILIKFIAIDKNIFSFGKDENFNSIYNLYVKNEETWVRAVGKSVDDSTKFEITYLK